MLVPLEMVIASRMQKMVQIRKKNMYVVTNLPFFCFDKSYLGALGVQSPDGGAIKIWFYLFLDDSLMICSICFKDHGQSSTMCSFFNLFGFFDGLSAFFKS